MTTYEINYRNRLDEMLDNIIRKYGFEHYVTVFFARLIEKFYNQANYQNREYLERHYQGFMKKDKKPLTDPNKCGIM